MGAPPAEQWKAAFSETLMGHFPAYADYLRWRAALEGTARSDRKSDEPATVGQTALRSLGVTTARGEIEPERRKRLASDIGRRGQAAGRLLGAVDQAVAAGKLQNPFLGEASRLNNFDEGRQALLVARTYLRTMITSPKNITADGKVTGPGRQRIRDAYLRVQALARRIGQLRRGL